MKYNIQAGAHPAQIDLAIDDKGNFAGVISHTEFGDGQITGGHKDGQELAGKVVLANHTADFKATITGTSIAGNIHVGWFFSQDFTGTQAA